MAGKKNQSAILAKYYNSYKQNPRSRVFAPLAESYRKLGMLEDAFKILKEGIRFHPDYVLGYIVLANCYFDQQKYDLTYNTLRPIVSKNADNISLQKLFGEACIKLGHLEEALDTFKYLLFMNPKDKLFAQQVKKLEDDLQVGHKKLSLDQLIKAPEFKRDNLKDENDDDDWIQVNFISSSNMEVFSDPLEIKNNQAIDSSEDQWVMKQSSEVENTILKDDKIFDKDLEDEYFADEFESQENQEKPDEFSLSPESPIISHTLIDLYCSQKYYDKAIELLEKIIELNPTDLRSKEKLDLVKQKKAIEAISLVSLSEQDGHDELISIIEKQVKKAETVSSRTNLNVNSEISKIQHVYNKFLEILKEKANHVARDNR